MASFTSTTRSPSAYRAAPRTFVSGAPTCPRCDKSVYAAEQVLGPGGREYHKRCLTCVSCKKSVGPGSFEEHEGDPYCKHCYSKNFGPKGYGHGGVMTGEYHDPILSRSPYSSPARSSSVRNSLSYGEPETSGPSVTSRVAGWGVDKAEPASPTRTAGKTTIDSPMNVYNRSRMQDLGDDMEEDLEPAADAETKESILGPPSVARERPSLPPKPQFQPRPSSPLKPSYSVRPESPASSTETSSTSLTGSTSMSMHNQQSEDRPPSSASMNSNLATYKSNLGLLGSTGPDLCRRCSGTVYHAEKVVAGGHKWHKRCLRCAKCSKALDSHLVEKDNLPYCKKCYDEAWGLKSQGFVLRPALH